MNNDSNERSELLRKLNYEDYPPPKHLFAVVSWGCAATNWLANVLNDCPGILCLHAANFYWELFAGAKAISGVEYMRIIGMLGTSAVAAGEVHGFSRSDVPALRAEFGDAFRTSILVRNPLPRLRSQLALFDRYATTRAWDVAYVDDKFPEAVAMLPTGSYNERLFIHGVNMLNAIIEEVGVAPIVKMEDVTTRPEALIALVSHLTGGSVTPNEHWAYKAASMTPTNRHALRGDLTLDDWQVRVLGRVFHDKAIELYRDLGYVLGPPLLAHRTADGL